MENNSVSERRRAIPGLRRTVYSGPDCGLVNAYPSIIVLSTETTETTFLRPKIGTFPSVEHHEPRDTVTKKGSKGPLISLLYIYGQNHVAGSSQVSRRIYATCVNVRCADTISNSATSRCCRTP
jgi:hypothetical protein